jgi:hypothetical protein
MKNIAINTLKYTGIVTLSQYIGKDKTVVKKIKNAGGAALFNFLADCIAGDFDIAKLTRPTRIMLLNADKELTNITPVSGFIPILTSPEKVSSSTGTVGAVRYSFIIPREYFELNFNSIGLYSNVVSTDEADKFSAFAWVDIASNSISKSSVLVVDWELMVTNAPNNTVWASEI